MHINQIKYVMSRRKLSLIMIFLFFSLCLVNSSLAGETEVEKFPWELFYPAIIKKPIDKDNDGFTEEQGDCNDTDNSTNPNAKEICGDGVDQDCDGTDMPCDPGMIDNDQDGFTVNQGDCNDLDPSINPNAYEFCGDSIDQDCNGRDIPCDMDSFGSVTYSGAWAGTYQFDGIVLDQYIYENHIDPSEGELSVTHTYNSNFETEVLIKTTSNTPGVYALNDSWNVSWAETNTIRINLLPLGWKLSDACYKHRNAGNITITRFDQIRVEGLFNATFEEYDCVTIQPTGVVFSAEGTFSVPYDPF